MTRQAAPPVRDRDLTVMQRFLDRPDLFGDVTWVGPTLFQAALQAA